MVSWALVFIEFIVSQEGVVSLECDASLGVVSPLNVLSPDAAACSKVVVCVVISGKGATGITFTV